MQTLNVHVCGMYVCVRRHYVVSHELSACPGQENHISTIRDREIRSGGIDTHADGITPFPFLRAAMRHRGSPLPRTTRAHGTTSPGPHTLA